MNNFFPSNIEKKTGSNILTYRMLVNKAQNEHKYLSLNGRDILNFPLHVPVGTTIDSFLSDTFDKYYTLLDDVGACQSEIKVIKNLGERLLEVLKTVNCGDFIKAYNIFEKSICEIKELLPISEVTPSTPLFRMRRHIGLQNKEDLYPLNANLRYLSKPERFSLIGYPCLYVGYSEKVCRKEIGENGSMIRLSLKKGQKFKVLQLTFSNDMTGQQLLEHNFIRTWPLIASCMIVPFYCLSRKCECVPENLSFREEYIIPQMLTLYLKRNYKQLRIDGIEYYSVKDVDLDPYARGKDDMRNLMLMDNHNNYDEFVNCFDWSDPYEI